MMHYGIYTTDAHEGVVSGSIFTRSRMAPIATWDMLKGLITFPSYHACAAALFALAAWPIRFARWPLVALNSAMMVACVVVGSQYLVDVLGGVLVAGVSLVLGKSADQGNLPKFTVAIEFLKHSGKPH